MALNLVKLSKNLRHSCCFHTTKLLVAKPGSAMKKIMGSFNKKKRIYSEAPMMPTPNSFSEGSHEGRYSGNARRTSVLNKLFMEHITDLMATGESASEFVGYGIEINRVQVTPDFKGVNVFWVAKGTQDDDAIEALLKKNTGVLRHELSTLRVMGMVPIIKFVKDKEYAKLIELDARLSQADFGEDYVPVKMETKLKTQLEIYSPIPPDVKEKIYTLDNLDLETNEDLDEPLPPMPQDVLGLNHSEILNRIKKTMRKSEAVHRLNSNVNFESSQTVNENPLQYSRAAFKEFLEKRELTRSKARKQDKNYIPDLEYMKEEFRERGAEYFKNMDIYDNSDEMTDYLDEDDVNKK